MFSFNVRLNVKGVDFNGYKYTTKRTQIGVVVLIS